MKLTVKDAKTYLRTLTDLHISVKSYYRGVLFAINGEYYMHQCHITCQIANDINAAGKYKASYVSIGAFYYLEVLA